MLSNNCGAGGNVNNCFNMESKIVVRIFSFTLYHLDKICNGVVKSFNLKYTLFRSIFC